ncbi:unnamed protein product [Didymodactylos carnosus]|uniref:Thioredoxin-like fold domain-containing protein n=1 Tax=Didymodactylos carnosus TaxID=1234261 RepID=A0A8S2EA47_9BILA|nr:unnamed protein product [Didymodactylos carnosus]CAF3983170.1 unnamed protein product [Didymodactylos carnosus]
MLFKLVLLILSAIAYGKQIPIPTRPEGYGIIGSPDANIIVEMYLDLLCDDCQASWPTIMSLVYYYDTRIQFLIHPFPFPYHTNSFLVNQGLHVVANVTEGTINLIKKYAQLALQHQSTWYNEATMNMTITEVIQSVANFIANDVQVATVDRVMRLMQDKDINERTVISWKYACSRGVFSTPTFMVNGVYVSADSSWTLDNWRSVIDPLNPECPSVCPRLQMGSSTDDSRLSNLIHIHRQQAKELKGEDVVNEFCKDKRRIKVINE